MRRSRKYQSNTTSKNIKLLKFLKLIPWKSIKQSLKSKGFLQLDSIEAIAKGRLARGWRISYVSSFGALRAFSF